MKGYPVIILWLASLSSCINLPPPSPMGDGAVQQIGLINVTPGNGYQSPKVPSKTTVSVTDKGVAITMPKK